MNISAQTTAAEKVDESVGLLEGWDTVYAIRYADVNSAIAKAKSSPTEFDQTITGAMLLMVMPEGDWGESARAFGSFGDWAVAPGGSGHIVKMTLPVPTVTLERPGEPDQTRTDVTFGITVELAPVERKGAFSPLGGQLFDFKLLSPQAAGKPTISVQTCDYAGSDSDLIVRTFLIGIMTAWLNDNTDAFDHTFATVNLNAKAAHDKFDWLMPTATSYAVKDDGTLESGIFGVLCMTENRPASKNQQIMDEALPVGERSAFLISRERFLKKMLAPGLGTMFTGPQKEEAGKVWPDDYFQLTDKDTAITNTAALKIENFDVGKEGEPELVTAKLGANKITAKLEETYLNVDIRDLTHPYFWFIGGWYLNVHHTIVSRNVARLRDDQVFDLVPLHDAIGEKTAEHTAVAVKTDHAKVIEWAEIFIGLMALAFPLARAGWLRYVAAPVEEGEAAATGTAAIVVEGVIDEAQATEMAAEGAQGALAFIRRGLTGLRNWLVSSFQSWHGCIAWSMTALFTTEQILQAIADGGAPEKLPKYREFAATVMSPIQWPEASEYEVTSVQFNGSFQTFGNPKFSF